jgi:repressor LexA
MPLNTAKSSTQLTPRQLQLLKLVAGFQESRCYSPTLGEMASELNISRSTVFEHIAELRKKGLLCGSPNRARSLTLSLQAHELLSCPGRDALQCFAGRSVPFNPSDPAGIPLAGRVAAGAPLEAVENIESLSLASCFGDGDDLFALEVTGDSMINEDIREGDYVICRRSRVAENGQLVIAIVDDENATLKRFYKEADRARLQPANDDYQPIYSDNCRIEAVVIGLVRRL